MFSLFKLAFDLAASLAIFYAGMKVQQSYPNFLTKLASIFSWLKTLVSKA